MARYIDAERLKMTFASGIRVYDGMCKIDDVMHNIDNEPTADVVEVKHGSWTFSRSERKVVCSCCETTAPFDKKVGYHTLWRSPYCPNCGAKMGAERNDEDGNR